MANTRTFLSFAACLAVALCAGTVSFADNGKDAEELERALKDHTLVFTDRQSGVENTIYFGRFGDNFDRYVPCVETAGTWKIADGGRLCLEEDEGPLNVCFKISVSGGRVTLSEADGEGIQTAKLFDGNRLPFG